MSRFLHIDLDGAWDHRVVQDAAPGMEYLDARHWGPQLRYCSTRKIVERFYRELQERLTKFTLFGSGDFHHLSALWLRKIDEPFTLISFDNHPDWDTRPPHWCCGTWISRALKMANLEQAYIWGCGNFELNWPHRIFANYRGIRAGRLHARPWGERLNRASLPHWRHMARENWREMFAAFAEGLAGQKVYITVDMDCLASTEAVTNWESGLFTAQDVAWALSEINATAEIIGGDVCGAYSPLNYARFFQKMFGKNDHPAQRQIALEKAQEINLRAFRTIWPQLTQATPAPVEAPVAIPVKAGL